MNTESNTSAAEPASSHSGASGALTISVVMPVYNGMGFIEKSLPPLQRMLEKGEILEIIVVDDGSTDDTSSYAQSKSAKVIPSGGRLGPGGARNQAANIARGEVLWFIDADVIVHETAAQRLKVALEQPDVVAVFGSYDDKPAAGNFFSQYKNLVHHYYHHLATEEAQTFWSGCGAIRKQAFLDAGGFDVVQFKYPSVEDIELGHRLLLAGGRILLRKEILCTHLKVWRLGNLLHTEIFRRAIPWSRLIIIGTGLPNNLNVGIAEQVRAVFAGILLLSLLAVLAGLVPALTLAPVVLVVLLANKDIARFFFRQRGFWFAGKALLFHQVYYLYSSGSFAWVVLEQALEKVTGGRISAGT
ncbi:MAG: glycosyltransferase family 2 protein [Halioglobus sp.]